VESRAALWSGQCAPWGAPLTSREAGSGATLVSAGTTPRGIPAAAERPGEGSRGKPRLDHTTQGYLARRCRMRTAALSLLKAR